MATSGSKITTFGSKITTFGSKITRVGAELVAASGGEELLLATGEQVERAVTV